MSSGPAKLLVARSSPTPLKFESSGEIPCCDALPHRLSELRSSSVSGAVRVFQGTALQEVRVYRQAGEISPPEIFHFTLFLKR